MRKSILKKLSWEEIQEIYVTANATLHELDTCKNFPDWSDSSESVFNEVKRRLGCKAANPKREKRLVWSIVTEVFTFLLSAGSLLVLYEIFKYFKELIETLD